MAGLLIPAASQAHLSEGLWAGHVVLNEVNEVVSAVDANNVRVQTPPQVTTPTADQLQIPLLLHVDAGGAVLLLKSVAIVDSDADPLTVDEQLLTDPQLYPQYALARRFASAAFEFGDPQSRDVVGSVATAAATAAAASATNPTQAHADALAAAQTAVSGAGDLTLSPSLEAFVGGASFQGSPVAAAEAAAAAAVAKYAEGLRNIALTNAVRSEVLIGLQTLSQMADGTSLNELPLNGELVKGGVLQGNIFLGAYHPTNPFRHRRHPSHRGGFDIARSLRLTVAEPEGGDDFDTTERGVDRLTGIYEEEVVGLHKPLGQAGEFGLRTRGFFVLDRISRDATLNVND
ncbi:MAG TPA: hypothetical protein VMN36_18935 [Verrucomicrobiales bacterium]|nr:hypothetical protein [Verrucomicrobiales bacterium]